MARRAPTAMEIALGVAIGGSFLAIAVPTFAKNLHASRSSEAVRGTAEIARGAITYAGQKGPPECFPPSAPLTPAEIPRGDRVTDPPGAWDHMTWHALGFSIDYAHSYSFAFDSIQDPAIASFTARAQGDLDGDGEPSTFEVRGSCTPNERAHIEPGLFVDREVE
jgi:hypothetical protein